MFTRMINAHIQCFQDLKTLAPQAEKTAALMLDTLLGGHRILVCGNGGSAADAQHFAAEIVGRFEKERRAFPAMALTTDTCILTAIANDYSFDEVFSRQVAGLGTSGDILIGISTSGGSTNVIRAVETASTIGMKTIGLLGRDGGRLKSLVDHSLVVSGKTTARIQESHGFILHFWAGWIENGLTLRQGDPS